jgi:hypothetical protein
VASTVMQKTLPTKLEGEVVEGVAKGVGTVVVIVGSIHGLMFREVQIKYKRIEI